MTSAPFPKPFDRLRRDKNTGGYKAGLTHRGYSIWALFPVESRQELDVLLPVAVKFWKSRVQWFKAFRDYAATELLDELNDVLDDGEEDRRKVTAAMVRRVLPVPFSIYFDLDDDGPERVAFEMSGGEDESILEDNCFEVRGTLEDGITSGSVVTLM